MNTDSRTREEYLGKAGLMRVTIGGQERDFRFPDNRYMRNVLDSIFGGTEYPILNLPGYVAEKIVDIGANVGATMVFFHNVYPAAAIWCYEPCRESFWCLEVNARNISQDILVFPYGLLDRDCELPIYGGRDQCGQNSLVHSIETNAVATETVRLVQASREARERGWQHLSIVKIDTEGCEIPILRELLSVVPKIDMIYCEYHAEEDRRTIDSILTERFILGASKSVNPHQGLCLYVSRALIQRYPIFEALRKSICHSGS